jgi:hypothetical protein
LILAISESAILLVPHERVSDSTLFAIPPGADEDDGLRSTLFAIPPGADEDDGLRP